MFFVEALQRNASLLINNVTEMNSYDVLRGRHYMHNEVYDKLDDEGYSLEHSISVSRDNMAVNYNASWIAKLCHINAFCESVRMCACVRA